MALVALVAFAYANALGGALVHDGGYLIGHDPRLSALSLENLRRIFTENAWWPSFASPLYRPLTTLSYLVNAQLLGSGTRPLGYHLINLALHAVNAGVVFALARRLLGGTSRGPAFFAAAVFAVHPVATEAVTYLVGRADELAAMGVLLGLLLHLRALERPGSRGRAAIPVGLAALLGAFSKEIGVVLLPVLVLHDTLCVWPKLQGAFSERRRALTRLAGADYLAAAIPALALALARYFAAVRGSSFLGWPFPDNPLVAASPGVRVLTAAKVLGKLLLLELFPKTLSCDYSFNAIPLYGAGRVPDALCWLALAGLLGLVGLAFAVRQRAPVLALAVGFWLLALLPTSNLLFPIGTIMAERFLYLPGFGFCLAAGLGFAALGRRVPRRALLSAGGLVLVALAVRTQLRNRDWRDELTLWTRAAKAEPQSFRVHEALARALWAQGPTEEHAEAAIREGRRAVSILAGLPLAQRDAHPEIELAQYLRGKGELLRARGDDGPAQQAFERALNHLDRALEVDGWSRAQLGRLLAAHERVAAGAGDDRLQLALFQTELDLGDLPKAEAAARTAARQAPSASGPHVALARLHLARGELDPAAVELIEAVMLDGSDSSAWMQLRTLFGALGDDGAVRQVGQGFALDSSRPVVRQHLDEACRALVQGAVDAGDLSDARLLYDHAADPQGFGCTPAKLGPRP